MKNASFDDEMTFAIGFEGMNLKGLYSISRILIRSSEKVRKNHRRLLIRVLRMSL